MDETTSQVNPLNSAPSRPVSEKPKVGLQYTVDDYLAFERKSKDRHVFLDGDILAMAGASGDREDRGNSMAKRNLTFSLVLN